MSTAICDSSRPHSGLALTRYSNSDGGSVDVMQGWRLVFYILAGLAGMTTVLLFTFGLEPRTASRNVKLRSGMGRELLGRNLVRSHDLLKQIYSSIKVSSLLDT